MPKPSIVHISHIPHKDSDRISRSQNCLVATPLRNVTLAPLTPAVYTIYQPCHTVVGTVWLKSDVAGYHTRHRTWDDSSHRITRHRALEYKDNTVCSPSYTCPKTSDNCILHILRYAGHDHWNWILPQLPVTMGFSSAIMTHRVSQSVTARLHHCGNPNRSLASRKFSLCLLSLWQILSVVLVNQYAWCQSQL